MNLLDIILIIIFILLFIKGYLHSAPLFGLSLLVRVVIAFFIARYMYERIITNTNFIDIFPKDKANSKEIFNFLKGIVPGFVLKTKMVSFSSKEFFFIVFSSLFSLVYFFSSILLKLIFMFCFLKHWKSQFIVFSVLSGFFSLIKNIILITVTFSILYYTIDSNSLSNLIENSFILKHTMSFYNKTYLSYVAG